MPRSFFVILILSCCGSSYAQSAPGPTAKYSFNQGVAKNETTGSEAKTVGVTLTEDRFGNPASAYYFHGGAGSYINLGTDTSIKQIAATISLWFKMDNVMYGGKGYTNNPIIVTKCHGGKDFNEAFFIAYNLNSQRVGVAANNVTSQDSLQTAVASNMRVKEGRWYHVVMCYDDSWIMLYIDGVLQNKVAKNFRTKFLEGDSVILGYSASTKNIRYFNGVIDDVEIYNRVLSPGEILALYEASDPNTSRRVIKWLVVILAGAVAIVLLMVLLLKREKIKNRKQQRIYEMEMQIIKAQMNPHFLFNAINSVQHLILDGDNDNAHKYLVKFSRLLRMILESNYKEHISLETEIDILTKYIEIEALRFEKSFSYEIVTDAGINTSNIRIPQMLIQPLVENAIWHGLLPKKENRNLSIKFERTGQRLLSCIIDDNGVGRYARKPEAMVSKRRSLAINFIYQRLELMKKEWNYDYGIQIMDKTDEQAASAGTRVVIKMPIMN